MANTIQFNLILFEFKDQINFVMKWKESKPEFCQKHF